MAGPKNVATGSAGSAFYNTPAISSVPNRALKGANNPKRMSRCQTDTDDARQHT